MTKDFARQIRHYGLISECYASLIEAAMTNPAGETNDDNLRLDFDVRLS
jgi:hypothetical protein